MKMWTSLSVSRCIFLLTLAVVVFFSWSQADSVVGLSCCRSVSTRKITRIKWCYEQKPREGCNRHAFLIATKQHKDKPWCINPNSKWLKDKIEKDPNYTDDDGPLCSALGSCCERKGHSNLKLQQVEGNSTEGELNCPQDLSLLNEVVQVPNKTTKA